MKRCDGDGKHLAVKLIVVSIDDRKVENISDWLITGLKCSCVSVNVKNRIESPIIFKH